MRISLELLNERHAPELLAAAQRSRELHLPWVELPASLERMQFYLRHSPESYLRFGIRVPSGELAGVANISAIVRGMFQNGFLGFYAFVPHAGQGLMFEGLRSVISCAFGQHGLHRV